MATELEEFRLGKGIKRGPKSNEQRLYAGAYKRVMHFVRASRRLSGQAGGGGGPGGAGKVRGLTPARAGKAHHQKCSVRVSYVSAAGAPKGLWGAHGRYIQREGAITKPEGVPGVFGSDPNAVDHARVLNEWQIAGDERMFKLIVSPEFGEHLDHELHTRALIQHMERDLNTRLEWVAATHWNTEHTHTHIALRGVDERGDALKLPPDYVKRNIREHAAALATQQLGYRTEQDTVLAAMRQVSAQRYTGLDASIKRVATATPASQFMSVDERKGPGNVLPQLRQRLGVLQGMGLARRDEQGEWSVRNDFDRVLSALEKTADRQRSLSAHRALLSDARLPMQFTDFRQLRVVEGRVLGHGEDEASGKSFVLLEGIDRKVHYLYHDKVMGELRHRNGMQPGAYVRVRKAFQQEGQVMRPHIVVTDFGDAEKLLSDQAHLRKVATRHQRGIGEAAKSPIGGWLGRYESAVAEIAATLTPGRTKAKPARPRNEL